MKPTPTKIVFLLNEHIPGKISRNEFCRATGINRNSVDRYLAGIGHPNIETLQKLADYFDETFTIEIKPSKGASR